ncbi:unnamed protein product [Kuraishia capsulata CBS 1993]|uniref:Uncharacterized protein n=1 Tax=Kuraishia capsulata CBS 1993 TaxID=1382522 RepID=W6MUD8_9ASCO|nr:uncharacterized protein KUCA_T00005159001 [Kuraishia capsulata CBS 1993]CDK29172.1 unnamed protein product [Kuraishia capsulata CBS 1993]
MSNVKSIIVDVGELPTKDPVLKPNILELFSLKGKVASITGSSQGIGYAIAESFAQAGADIALWYNSTPADELAASLSSKYGVTVRAYKCPIDDFSEVHKTINKQVEDFGRIDVFVANAGVAWSKGEILGMSDDEGQREWRKIWSLDVDAVYYCAKSVGEVFKKQGYGSFIATASMSGHIVNFPQMQSPYNAAKAAVLHLMKSFAIEWAGFARVNTVSPGYIKTEMTKSIPLETRAHWWPIIPMGREGLPQELAGAYLYLASDASTYTTGSDIKVDGGYCAV